MHEMCKGDKEMKIFYFKATAEELKANLTVTEKLAQIFSKAAINLSEGSCTKNSEGDDREN
nr:MAG TPA: hypothetical protein [Caudoviricetes sp.]